MAIELGRKVKDRITGFTGITTGRCVYLTGCNQVLVAPGVGADGSLRDSHWIDEQKIEYVDDSVISLDNGQTPGFDKPAPKGW